MRPCCLVDRNGEVMGIQRLIERQNRPVACRSQYNLNPLGSDGVQSGIYEFLDLAIEPSNDFGINILFERAAHIAITDQIEFDQRLNAH